MQERSEQISYSIMNPTGNITALVESPVEIRDQSAVASRIMLLHREVEQVGFVSFDGQGLPSLRMAGGEFCGNAAMSAAALFLIRKHEAQKNEAKVVMRVSGAESPVEVTLVRSDNDAFRAGLCMPPALSVEERKFSFAETTGMLPVVKMEGITHLIVEANSPFAGFVNQKEKAESAVRAFCAELSADCLGMLFLQHEGPCPEAVSADSVEAEGNQENERILFMRPLVYVPGSGTLFWENSCASGSAAAGIRKAVETGKATDISLIQPGGSLRVSADPETMTATLSGKIRLTGSYTF